MDRLDEVAEAGANGGDRVRVRLLIDVELADDTLVELSEALTEQPVAIVHLPHPFGMLGGRCMGAHHPAEPPSMATPQAWDGAR
jgi:hypothetical protein